MTDNTDRWMIIVLLICGIVGIAGIIGVVMTCPSTVVMVCNGSFCQCIK